MDRRPASTFAARYFIGIACCTLAVACGAAGSASGAVLSTPLPLESRPLLSVHASASAELAADVAQLSFAVEAVAATPDEAVRQASLSAQSVVRALQAVVIASSISTAEVSLSDTYSVPPTPEPEHWLRRVIAHRARIGINAKDVEPASAMAAFQKGMAGGATAGTITLGRKACSETLRALRTEALNKALARARMIAARAGGRLGVLYRVKEDFTDCSGSESGPIISVQVRPDESGAAKTPLLSVPELGMAVPRATLLARVQMLLVYELASDTRAPSGEAPGEVHLGLTRVAHAGTQDITGTVRIRTRVVDADPSTALLKAGTTMDRLTQALRAAGLTDEEHDASRAQLDTRTTVATRGEHLARVPRDYIAESSIAVTTSRFDELGRWLALAAQLGATGLEGPFYAMREPEPVLDRALAFATSQVAADARLMAGAAGQRLRAPTHVRIQSGWLSEADPLRMFLEELGHYIGYGRGAGGYHSRDAELRPDTAFPPVTILPPTLYENGEVAIGFALTPDPTAD